MATPPSLMQLAFASGIDESQEDEILDPMSGFPVLQNGRQDLRGGYSKRLGYTNLGNVYVDNTERTTGARVLMSGPQLCVIDGTNLDVYSETLARSVDKGRVPEALVTTQGLPTMGAQFSGVEDMTFCNGYLVASYITTVSYDPTTINFGSFTVLVDPATGTVLRRDLQAISTSVVGSRLARYGNYVFSFSPYTAGDDIFVQYIDLTSAATIEAGWVLISVALTGADFANGGYDVAEMASNDRVALAYGALSSSGHRITVKTLNISGVIETVNIATSTAMTNTYGVGLSEGASTLWVSWVDTLSVKAIGLNPTDIDGTALATMATVMTLGAGVTQHVGVYIEPRAATTAAVFVSTYAGATGAWSLYSGGAKTLAGAAASDGITNVIGSAVLGSRPFLRGGRFYAHVASPNDEDGTLCDVTPNFTAGYVVSFCRPVASAVARGLFCNSPAARRQRSTALDSTRYAYGLTLKKSGTTFGNALATYDFASPYRWRPARVNGTTCLGGGVTSLFDGVRTFEMGFLVAPQVPKADNSGGTGLTMTNGRRYVATFEEVDNYGNWHVSGVSAPCTISGAQSNKACVVSVGPLSITSRISLDRIAESSLRVVIYATLDNNDGEEPYHRVGSVVNDPNATMLTFSDTTSEASLATGALLYGTGNLPATGASQDHRAPPGLTHIASFNGMLVGAAGTSVFYSSQPIDGEGQWFSPAFVQAVDDEVTGLAVQDGVLLVFTRTGVWSTQGEPPSDNGFQGGLNVPRRLAVELGCANANSIVSTSSGTFYQSTRGIELINRSGGNEWIGERVQRTLADFPVITSAVLDIAAGTGPYVRFTLAEAISAGVVSGEGRDLIFDLSLRGWISVDDKIGTASSAHEASQDAAYIYAAGAWRYGWLGVDGVVHYERAANDASAHLDGSTWVAMAAETAWFKASGIQGKQALNQVLILARKATDCELSVSLSYNFEETFRAARTWSWDEVSALLIAGWPITQLKHEPHDDAECQAFRIRLEDAESSIPESGPVPTTGSGKGAKWLALTMDVTPQTGAFEVPEEAA